MAKPKTRGYRLIATRYPICQRPTESNCPLAVAAGHGRPCLACVADTVRNKLVVARLLALAVRNGASSPLTEKEFVVARGLLAEVVDAIDAAGMVLAGIEDSTEPKIERREERSPSYIG